MVKMLPNEKTDLIIGFLGLSLLVVVGASLTFSGQDYAVSDSDFDNDLRLMLLNLMRTSINDMDVADLIALAEEGDVGLLTELSEVGRANLNFGNRGRDYILSVTYPGKEEKIVASYLVPIGGDYGPSAYKIRNPIKRELEIPSLKTQGGKIKVILEVENE